MNGLLKRFMAKYGGQLSGLLGHEIPELGTDVERVAGWSKGAGQRDKIKKMISGVEKKYGEMSELKKLLAAGGLSAGGTALGSYAMSDGPTKEDYELLLKELEDAKR